MKVNEKFMSKVVYNACYGGFSLSLEAQKMYLELKGETPVLEEGKSTWDTFYRSKENFDFYDRDIPRNDPALVQTVETLGKKANGECAELRVAELPKGTLFRITEYDGYESVETRDTTDWCCAV